MGATYAPIASLSAPLAPYPVAVPVEATEMASGKANLLRRLICDLLRHLPGLGSVTLSEQGPNDAQVMAEHL